MRRKKNKKYISAKTYLPVKKHHMHNRAGGLDAQYKEMQMKGIEILERNCKYDLCQKSISEPCQHRKRLRSLCSHIASQTHGFQRWEGGERVGERERERNQYLAVLITMIGHSCQGHRYAEAHR